MMLHDKAGLESTGGKGPTVHGSTADGMAIELSPDLRSCILTLMQVKGNRRAETEYVPVRISGGLSCEDW